MSNNPILTPDLIITPENVTKELLKAICDAAYMETSVDADGDVVVRDGGIRGYLILSSHHRHIRIMAQFSVTEGANKFEVLEFLNRVNDEYVLVRCALINNGKGVRFDHYVCLPGGVRPANLVQTIKRFLSIPPDAIKEHGNAFIS
jgi:hypothetical protein